MNVSGLDLSYMGAQTIWANDLGTYPAYVDVGGCFLYSCSIRCGKINEVDWRGHDPQPNHL